MISGGITTLYVSNMDRAIEFYTRTLRLTLRKRYTDKWAEVVAGPELTLGLHPIVEDEQHQQPPSSIKIGLRLDGPIAEAVEELTARGVVFRGPIQDDGPVNLAFFADPDGNPLYLYELVEAAAGTS